MNQLFVSGRKPAGLAAPTSRVVKVDETREYEVLLAGWYEDYRGHSAMRAVGEKLRCVPEAVEYMVGRQLAEEGNSFRLGTIDRPAQEAQEAQVEGEQLPPAQDTVVDQIAAGPDSPADLSTAADAPGIEASTPHVRRRAR